MKNSYGAVGGADGASLFDLGRLEQSESLEIVVPYTSPAMTARMMDYAAVLAGDLNVTLTLVAVCVVPYPADLIWPASTREHLIARLTELAGRTRFQSKIHVVLAREVDEGFREVLRPGSAVLLGSRRRPWRTREEKLARQLTHEGHHVSLLHFDSEN